MATFHVYGGQARDFMDLLRENGYRIAVDSTTDKFAQLLPWPDQFALIFNTGIEESDVILISFDGVDCSHACFSLYALAVSTGKRVILYDPDAVTRSELYHGRPVHPALHNLMGLSCISAPNVVWTFTRDEVLAVARQLTPWMAL